MEDSGIGKRRRMKRRRNNKGDPSQCTLGILKGKGGDGGEPARDKEQKEERQVTTLGKKVKDSNIKVEMREEDLAEMVDG